MRPHGTLVVHTLYELQPQEPSLGKIGALYYEGIHVSFENPLQPSLTTNHHSHVHTIALIGQS